MTSPDKACKYALVDGANVFLEEWIFDPVVNSTSKMTLAVSNLAYNVSYDNLLKGAISINIFADGKDCRVSIVSTSDDKEENYCVNGQMTDGVCICHRYWAGTNCDKFTLRLVFVLAAIAGAFILATILTTLIIKIFFTQQEPNYDRLGR